MQAGGIFQARYVDAVLYFISTVNFHNHTFRFAGATAQSGAAYGPGTGPISLINVGCFGNESRLADCPLGNITTGCTHSNDASATCVTQCKSYNLNSCQNSSVGWFLVGYG